MDVSFLQPQEEIVEVVQHTPQGACDEPRATADRGRLPVPRGVWADAQLPEEIVTAVQHTPEDLVMNRARKVIVAIPCAADHGGPHVLAIGPKD